MSLDPWSWGDDNSDQDLNNGWSSKDFQQNSKNSGFSGNPPPYSNNNSQSQSSHHNNQRNVGWNQPNQHQQSHSRPNQTQMNSTADYFSNKPLPPVNNNPFPDVENKEIAPPDHHQTHGTRQPMKLGKGLHSGLRSNTIKQDNTNNFGNVQQTQQGPPLAHPSDNHNLLPQTQQGYSMPPNQTSSRNQPHHYFNNQLQSNDTNSWSYFNKMDGPPSIPSQQSISGGLPSMPPQQSINSGPSLMPPQQSINSGPLSMPPQQSINSGPFSMPPQQSVNSGPLSKPPQQSMIGGPPPMPIHQSMVSGPSSMPPHQPINSGPSSVSSHQTLNNNSGSFPPHPTQHSDLPLKAHLSSGPVSFPAQPFVQESVSSGSNAMPHYQEHSGQTSLPPPPLEPDKQHSPPSAADFFSDNHQLKPSQESQNMNFFQMQDQEIQNSQDFQNTIPHFSQQNSNIAIQEDTSNVEKPSTFNNPLPEQNSQEQGTSNFQKQELDDRPSRVKDDIQKDSNQTSSKGDSPVSRIPEERTGPQGLADQPDIRSGSDRRAMPPPPQSMFSDIDKISQGRKRSGPLSEISDSRESQEHHFQERTSSQGKDWPGPFGPDRRGSHDKVGHQRTGSQGSDLSLGRGDRSGSDRSGSSSSRLHQNRPDGSRSDNRDFTITKSDINSMDNSVPRPDRVPSRSPGAGADRSCPPSRPDNLESLPPESHITQQMSQISINQMDDCPLDRNEYLETSQLSNQESTQSDIRTSRHPPSDSSRNSHSDRREVVGEAEPLAGRVVVGHTTPTTTPPPNHSDEVEGAGSGSMERMVVGERREQSSRNNRTNRRRNHHRRDSSFEEDDQDYSSDNRRGHRDSYRRDDRHRKKRGQEHRSSDYLSDEDYEIDRRAYSRRDRRGRDRDYEPRERDFEPRDRDRDYEPRDRERDYEPRDRERDREYEPEYRRDYYRDDHRRPGRGREYYRYDDEDYRDYSQRSRPSSRSGSDYRRTNLDYQSRNQSRHYFNPALAGVLGGREYEANPEYFEMLRKTNPVVYAIWYQDYMRKLQDTATHFTQSDRASIHSGQSSGNRINLSTPNQALDSNVENVEVFDDYSPRLFSTPHVRGSYDSQGRLVLVNACSPLDGQPASVQLLGIEPDDMDSSVKEFLDSPGPFIPGVTHKSTVLQYLRKMSDQAVKGSEKLLYDLVHLIVKSNGKPDCLDISELLLESYRNSKEDSRDDWDPDPSTIQPISHHEMLQTFRHLLHQGNKQEALDWAMKHGGWGHAFFLSSKMDSRTQTRVASEFTRALAASDPLSTLYQIMSGTVPASATSCIDKRWSDWRPHLAIVLSNLTENSNVNLSTVTTLADGLASRGRIYAAHSCYLIAQVMFGDLYKSDGPILLGWSEPISQSIPHSQPKMDSFSYKAFLLSLCYEYGVKQCQPNFFMPALQRYKLLIAWRLVEWGRGRQALLYCELLSGELVHSQNDLHTSDLVHLLIELSSKLKSLDPTAPLSAIDLSTSPDPDWLQQLKQLASTLPQEDFEPTMIPNSQPEPTGFSNYEHTPQHVPLYNTGSIDRGFNSGMRIDEPISVISPEANSTLDPPTSTSTPSKPSEMHQMPHQNISSIQQPLTQQMQQQPNSLPPMSNLNTFQQTGFTSQPPSFTGYEENGSCEVDRGMSVGMGVDNNVIKPAVWESEKQPEQPPQPSHNKSNFFHASESLLQGIDGAKVTSKPPASAQPTITDKPKKPDTSSSNSSGGWLGGIFGKLSMKPKNQMILPDDKDPKIVFDSKLNKWVDKDNEGGEGAKELKPPPMGGPSMPMVNPGIPQGNPGIPQGNPGLPMGAAAPGSNMSNKYKLQKGKSMKSNYVDILSNSGISSKVSGNMDPLMPLMPPHSDAVNSNLFVPQPVDNSGHLGDSNFQGQEQ